MNYILSYQRSGNHWVRFIIEYITNTPTLGCINNRSFDTPIHINFKNFVDNPLKDVDSSKSPKYTKAHSIHEIKNPEKLILIVRNPLECILSHNNYIDENLIKKYVSLIDYYNLYDGKKLLIYYEDLINKSQECLRDLGSFVDGDINRIEEFIKMYDEFFEKSTEMYKREKKGRALTRGKHDLFFSKIDENLKHIEKGKEILKKCDISVIEIIEKYGIM